MSICRGQLKRIGDGTWNGGLHSVSVIEIGERDIADVQYDSYMSTYLADALNTSDEIAIVLIDNASLVGKKWNYIYGLKIGNKKYASPTVERQLKQVRMFMLIVGVVLLATLLAAVISPIVFYGAWRAHKIVLRVDEAKRELSSL